MTHYANTGSRLQSPFVYWSIDTFRILIACALVRLGFICVFVRMVVWCMAGVQPRNQNHIVHTDRRKLVSICQDRKKRTVLINLVIRCIIIFSQCVGGEILSLSLSLSIYIYIY